MEKRISFDAFQSVKRVAQACNPLMVKREKIRAKVAALAEEYKEYDTQIASLEAGIVQVIGFRVEELVKKVVEPGKATKYVPTDMVTYDANHKQYVITYGEPEAVAPEVQQEPEHEEEVIVPPTTADGPGSDFDLDVENNPDEDDIF